MDTLCEPEFKKGLYLARSTTEIILMSVRVLRVLWSHIRNPISLLIDNISITCSSRFAEVKSPTSSSTYPLVQNDFEITLCEIKSEPDFLAGRQYLHYMQDIISCF